MNNSAERILYRKSALIFEQMGFLMPRPESSRASEPATTSAIVSFTGPFAGYLTVSLTPEIARQLSCNMLGDEKVSDEILQKDSLQEITHVICGNALPAIFGPENAFHLTPPLIHNGDTDKVTKYSKAAQALISFDTGMAEVRLFVESGAIKNLPQ